MVHASNAPLTQLSVKMGRNAHIHAARPMRSSSKMAHVNNAANLQGLWAMDSSVAQTRARLESIFCQMEHAQPLLNHAHQHNSEHQMVFARVVNHIKKLQLMEVHVSNHSVLQTKRYWKMAPANGANRSPRLHWTVRNVRDDHVRLTRS